MLPVEASELPGNILSALAVLARDEAKTLHLADGKRALTYKALHCKRKPDGKKGVIFVPLMPTGHESKCLELWFSIPKNKKVVKCYSEVISLIEQGIYEEYDPWLDLGFFFKKWEKLEEECNLAPLSPAELEAAKRLVIWVGPPGSGKNWNVAKAVERQAGVFLSELSTRQLRKGEKAVQNGQIRTLPPNDYSGEDERCRRVLNAVINHKTLCHYPRPETGEIYCLPLRNYRNAIRALQQMSSKWMFLPCGPEMALLAKSRFRVAPNCRPRIILNWPADSRWLDYWYEQDRKEEMEKKQIRLDYHCRMAERWVWLFDYVNVLTTPFRKKNKSGIDARQAFWNSTAFTLHQMDADPT